LSLGIFASAASLATDDGVERPAPGKAPTAFRIWKAGENPTDYGVHRFTKESANLLMADQGVRGNLYSIDVDHLSHDPKAPPENHEAMGWHKLATRETSEGPELWAVDVEWTDEVKAGLESKVPKWRYFSPAYAVDKKTGEILSYTNTAITNSPATHRVTALASIQRTIAATRRARAMSDNRLIQQILAAAASKKMTAKECLAALWGDDEEKKTEAMLMVAAAFPEEEGDDEKKKEAARKAAADEAEKKKEEDRKASEAEAEKKKEEARKASEDEKKKEEATKMAANTLALATELQQIKAERAAEKAAALAKEAAEARAAIFAKRPDIGATQREALSGLPNDQIEKVLATWPRVQAAPGSSVAALGAGSNREERVGYQARMSEEEQAIYASTNRAPVIYARAKEVGSASVLSMSDPALADARMKELEVEAKRLGMASPFGRNAKFGMGA
jgi:flagellar biosynthesis GTPase FlhF